MYEQDSPDLMLLLRMLSLGQGAWDMIDSQVFKEPRLVRTFKEITQMVQSGVHLSCLTGLCVCAARIWRW